jgi:hypothetical protein
MFFPVVSGCSLTDREFIVPSGLDGEFNLVIIAFDPSHQYAIRSWLPTLEFLLEEYPDFRYYQLPTLWDLPPMQRLFIDNGMRRIVQDEATRAIMIPLYVDKTAFAEMLQLSGEETITLALIDREGEILWRAEGIATRGSCAALIEQVRALFSVDNEINFPSLG